MSYKRVEKAHLIVIELSKKSTVTTKGSDCRKKNNQDNDSSPSVSKNVHNKGFKRQGTCLLCKKKGHSKVDCYKYKAMISGKSKSEGVRKEMEAKLGRR